MKWRRVEDRRERVPFIPHNTLTLLYYGKKCSFESQPILALPPPCFCSLEGGKKAHSVPELKSRCHHAFTTSKLPGQPHVNLTSTLHATKTFISFNVDKGKRLVDKKQPSTYLHEYLVFSDRFVCQIEVISS